MIRTCRLCTCTYYSSSSYSKPIKYFTKQTVRKFVAAFFGILLGFSVCLPPVFSFDHNAWDRLLKIYVKNGEVDYKAFQTAQDQLVSYLGEVFRLPSEELAGNSREERIAFWINVYNASVIRVIFDHYPIASIKEIPNFWDEKQIGVAGIRYSLKEVRENIFRTGFRDERATLSLISGMESSGPLREEAYTGSRLGEQLKDQMRAFLTDERYNQIRLKKKKFMLSPLFRELAKDFILGYGTAVKDNRFSSEEIAILAFIRIYVDDPELKKWIDSRKYKLKYLPEDITLNEWKEETREN